MSTSTQRVVYLKRLKYWRERRAMTQAELSEKAGITAAALSRLENSQAQPRPSTTRKLAEVLDVEPGVLMGPPDR